MKIPGSNLSIGSLVKTTVNDTIGQLSFWNGGIEASRIQSCVQIENANNNADLRFFTRFDYNNFLERMRITRDGYVGIGTSTPSVILDVNGTIQGYSTTSLANNGPDSSYSQGLLLTCAKSTTSSRYSMALGMDNTYGYGYINAAGNGIIQPICLQSRGGNVGIGTGSPNAPLTVNGNTNIYCGGGELGGSYINFTGVNGNYPIINATNDAGATAGTAGMGISVSGTNMIDISPTPSVILYRSLTTVRTPIIYKIATVVITTDKQSFITTTIEDGIKVPTGFGEPIITVCNGDASNDFQKRVVMSGYFVVVSGVNKVGVTIYNTPVGYNQDIRVNYKIEFY